jgi:predicted TIM-barrel fold metal-dependent hydrolase
MTNRSRNWENKMLNISIDRNVACKIKILKGKESYNNFFMKVLEGKI